jgi:cytochrome c oxidase cbb3-type subunit IV
MGDYFQTDWAAMTMNDWLGLIVTVGVFIMMIVAYVHVFNPRNRDILESKKHLPIDDESDTEK